MFAKLTILMCPNAINVNVALVFLLLILVTTSSLYLYKFSTVENLITIKETGNCNTVYNDCLIGLESWSNNLLRNKPVTDNSPMGTLITFNLGRKTQLYVSSTGVYSRVNQSQQDETSWTAWVKLS